MGIRYICEMYIQAERDAELWYNENKKLERKKIWIQRISKQYWE